jgi:hypothetical protein
MITSGNNVSKIAEKLAVLQNELGMNGKIGNFNIHKQAENLFRDILSMAYGIQLENLNETNVHSEGIDLVNKLSGTDYQVKHSFYCPLNQ